MIFFLPIFDWVLLIHEMLNLPVHYVFLAKMIKIFQWNLEVNFNSSNSTFFHVFQELVSQHVMIHFHVGVTELVGNKDVFGMIERRLGKMCR